MEYDISKNLRIDKFTKRKHSLITLPTTLTRANEIESGGCKPYRPRPK